MGGLCTDHIEKIRDAFTRQAEKFDEYQKSLSPEEHMRLVVEQMALTGEESALEVAAGTCAFGRAIAPHVKRIVELDATDAMLAVGRREGERAGIRNAVYRNGLAEELPFPDECFDVVASRLAFHHFADAEVPFREMCRVLKRGGKLVVVDMEAREEALRGAADAWERLRDPSHVRCLSRAEFKHLAEKNHMRVSVCEMVKRPVSLNAWMDLTGVSEENRAAIRAAMAEDIAGGQKTGLEPYEQEGRIMFDHRWLRIVAEKGAGYR
ncbi:MAG: methyltransferase domain-containing protein [Clostridiales bacterium]|jgi:ubiquinone/menaquinone biosynthesis C-methylase UbiE|nr:methyltransferase domain-containing protein [Clostridiales bacterium]